MGHRKGAIWLGNVTPQSRSKEDFTFNNTYYCTYLTEVKRGQRTCRQRGISCEDVWHFPDTLRRERPVNPVNCSLLMDHTDCFVTV